MFIKLTKLDGASIWINASFVVTVEPRKGGGAVVVPVGDGLDYDVRESPESVLAMLGDAPAPAILPIPTTDALKKAPVAAVSGPENVNQLVTEAKQDPEGRAKARPQTVPEQKDETPAADEPPAEGASPAEGAAPADVSAEPVKKTRKTSAAKKPRATRKAKKPAMPIPDDQLERLKKMMPKSVQKLQNTLQTQFRVEDAEDAVKALEANGVLTLDRDHVIWG